MTRAGAALIALAAFFTGIASGVLMSHRPEHCSVARNDVIATSANVTVGPVIVCER